MKTEIRSLKQSCPGDDITILDRYPEQKKSLIASVTRDASTSFEKVDIITRHSSSKQLDQSSEINIAEKLEYVTLNYFKNFGDASFTFFQGN